VGQRGTGGGVGLPVSWGGAEVRQGSLLPKGAGQASKETGTPAALGGGRGCDGGSQQGKGRCPVYALSETWRVVGPSGLSRLDGEGACGRSGEWKEGADWHVVHRVVQSRLPVT